MKRRTFLSALVAAPVAAVAASRTPPPRSPSTGVFVQPPHVPTHEDGEPEMPDLEIVEYRGKLPNWGQTDDMQYIVRCLAENAAQSIDAQILSIRPSLFRAGIPWKVIR